MTYPGLQEDDHKPLPRLVWHTGVNKWINPDDPNAVPPHMVRPHKFNGHFEGPAGPPPPAPEIPPEHRVPWVKPPDLPPLKD